MVCMLSAVQNMHAASHQPQRHIVRMYAWSAAASVRAVHLFAQSKVQSANSLTATKSIAGFESGRVHRGHPCHLLPR